jgi:zeaxanthin epoxidase
MVTDLIAATPEEDVIRRDIFDRPPVFKWTQGRVALLGDSAHAMQPNLGQGGCMAIEDSYELGKLLGEAMPAAARRADKANEGIAFHLDIEGILRRYQRERMMRASMIHGMARMAAMAASTYKAYLGEQFKLHEKIKILHPGRILGKMCLSMSMPLVLGWVLGGNTRKLKVSDRAQYCTLADQPRGFGQNDWDRLMRDDEALLRAAHALWVLAPLSKVRFHPLHTPWQPLQLLVAGMLAGLHHDCCEFAG